MLLRCSTNAGVTYYNNEGPHKTIPFDRNCPRRKLFVDSCNPVTGTFKWYNAKASLLKLNPFKTCFKFGSEERYCWTKSFYDCVEGYQPCVPIGFKSPVNFGGVG